MSDELAKQNIPATEGDDDEVEAHKLETAKLETAASADDDVEAHQHATSKHDIV